VSFYTSSLLRATSNYLCKLSITFSLQKKHNFAITQFVVISTLLLETFKKHRTHETPYCNLDTL